MPKLDIKKELVVKVEATKGVAEVLTPGTDSRFLVINARLQDGITKVERAIHRTTLSRTGHVTTIKTGTLTFTLEVRRSNSTDTPDEWGKLLQGCGLKQTVTAATNVVYSPESDPDQQKTLTIALNEDGILRKLRGAMGNVIYRGKVGELQYWDFEFQGVWDGPSTQALSGSITHETGLPLAFQGISFVYDTGGGTPADDLHIESLNFNLQNRVVFRPSANDPAGNISALITGRDPQISIDPEITSLTPSASARNFWADLTGDASFGLSWEASSNLVFAVPSWQPRSIETGEREGISMVQLVGGCIDPSDPGDGEFTLTCT